MRAKAPAATVGEWLLFCGADADRIVQAGDFNFGPSAARRASSAPVRMELLPLVEKAFKAGSDISTFVNTDHGVFKAEVHVIKTPLTSTPVAVQALLVEADQPCPPMPLVGAWEWSIELDEAGQLTLVRTTYWDGKLFKIYEVSPDTPEHIAGCWEVGTWQRHVISETDGLRLHREIRDGLREGIGGVRCLTFDVVTGYGSAKLGKKHLRLVGRIASENPPGRLLLQGVSYAVPDTFHENAFERDAGRVDDVLRGTMQLIDTPLAVVDPDTFEVLLTSPSWKAARFSPASSLLEVFGDQSLEVQKFIEAAADTTDVQDFHRPIPTFHLDGVDRVATMSVCGVRASDGVSMDALVKLTF